MIISHTQSQRQLLATVTMATFRSHTYAHSQLNSIKNEGFCCRATGPNVAALRRSPEPRSVRGRPGPGYAGVRAEPRVGITRSRGGGQADSGPLPACDPSVLSCTRHHTGTRLTGGVQAVSSGRRETLQDSDPLWLSLCPAFPWPRQSSPDGFLANTDRASDPSRVPLAGAWPRSAPGPGAGLRWAGRLLLGSRAPSFGLRPDRDTLGVSVSL